MIIIKKNSGSHHLQAMRAIILQDEHLVLCSYSSPVLLSGSFIGPPFWKKGPPKIIEGGLLVPHWPISRINPGFDFIFSITMAITTFAKQVAREFHNGKIKKKMIELRDSTLDKTI